MLAGIVGEIFPGAKALVAAAAIAVAWPAVAEPLTLNAALRLALDGHPLRQQKVSDIAAAGDELKGAEWKRYPTLTGSIGRNIEQNTAAAGVPRGATTWSLQQPLWTGGRIDSEIGGAETRQRIAEFALIETEQELILRVAQSYLDCQRLKERLEVAADNVAEHERLYQLINRRLKQEVSSEADAALAHARLQQARTEYLTLRSGYGNARSTLEQLVGLPLEGDPLPTALPDGGRSTVASIVDAARQFSPTLRRLEAEMQLAKNEVQTRKSALMPQVSARYEHLTGSAAVVPPSDRVMVVLEYQPGAGLSSVAQMDAAEKRVQSAQMAIEALDRDLRERAANQLNDANSFADQLAPTLDYAKSARDVMSSYLRQYTAGRKSWLDVLNTQRELSQARYTAADVTAGVILSALKLDALSGRLNRGSVLAGYPGKGNPTR